VTLCSKYTRSLILKNPLPGCVALYSLLQDKGLAHTVSEAGGIQVVLNAMQTHPQNEALNLKGMAIVALCVTHAPIALPSLVAAQGIEVAVAVGNSFGGGVGGGMDVVAENVESEREREGETLWLSVCEVVCSAAGGYPDRVRAAGGMHTLVAALQTCNRSAEIVLVCCRALKSLCRYVFMRMYVCMYVCIYVCTYLCPIVMVCC
jgi:hypothetical protein